MVFADCLEMKAIAGTVGVARGAVMAVKAGADVVLVSHTPALQIAALDALYEAVVAGEIAEERIDEVGAAHCGVEGRTVGGGSVRSRSSHRSDAGAGTDRCRFRR